MSLTIAILGRRQSAGPDRRSLRTFGSPERTRKSDYNLSALESSEGKRDRRLASLNLACEGTH